MRAAAAGIRDYPLASTPVAVLDFETTGLVPGADRVVEVAVVRVQAGRAPAVVLDSVVNPERAVGATFIHGLGERDVAGAPRFADIAGHVVQALAGCVVASYNASFDLRFLGFELGRLGVTAAPPHLCLMYLRPLLGLGPACDLDRACRRHGVPRTGRHAAAADALDAARLWQAVQSDLGMLGLGTYGDLAARRPYAFTRSFAEAPLAAALAGGLARAAPRPRSAGP